MTRVLKCYCCQRVVWCECDNSNMHCVKTADGEIQMDLMNFVSMCGHVDTFYVFLNCGYLMNCIISICIVAHCEGHLTLIFCLMRFY